MFSIAGVAENKVIPESLMPADSDASQVVVFKSLEQLDELIDLGVPALALSLLNDEQEKRPQFTVDWYTFEYKRIVLLSRLERWRQLIDRTQWLFNTAEEYRDITLKIRYWFETQEVIARLQLKQSSDALSQLQNLLWKSTAESRDPSLPAVWRRLVIRAYLQLSQDVDARKALLKYQQDYETNDKDIEWIVLQAQVLLKTNRPHQAIKILQKESLQNEVDVATLLLIAKLQSNPKSASSIYKKMRKQLNGQVLSKSERWVKLYVAYLATKIIENQSIQISNLEEMLSLDIRYPVFEDNLKVSSDDLWALYERQGLAIANNAGLLFGNDIAWQKLSDNFVKSQSKKALYLNAALVLHTENFSTQHHQHKTIVEILENRKNGLELINNLYLHSSKVNDVSVLPDEVRYRLVDYALLQGKYFEAATLMESLKEPPAGRLAFDWRMRKARVLVLQGKYKESEILIRKTFRGKHKITNQELDKYIQVIFDFQTVQQHKQAIRLFNLLHIDDLKETLKREIYFWKAESFYSLKQYDHAALFYLKSARVLTAGENDIWAQSARFKAGEALLSAEIYDDSEKIYKELLAITNSETRIALINQKLQKIRLLKSVLDK